MAGIIGIYGLVVSVLISDGLKQGMALYTGFIQLGAGLSVGLAGLAAGYAILTLDSEAASACLLLIANRETASQSASLVTQVSAARHNNHDYSSA